MEVIAIFDVLRRHVLLIVALCVVTTLSGSIHPATRVQLSLPSPSPGFADVWITFEDRHFPER